MKRFMAVSLILPLVWAFLTPFSAAQPEAQENAPPVPRQENAFEQFSHAMLHYYLPAARATGDQRKDLCRKAIPAFEAVRAYFPKTKDKDVEPLIRMESWFYQGKCQKILGDKRKAADAFLMAFREPIPGAALDDEEADRVIYHFHAYQELRDLQEVLTAKERAEVDAEEATDEE